MIDEDHFKEICKKAELYDKMIADRRKGANVINNIPAEDRKKRAQKAAAARWNKKIG